MPTDIAPEMPLVPLAGPRPARRRQVRNLVQAVAFYGLLGFGVLMPLTLGLYGTLTH